MKHHAVLGRRRIEIACRYGIRNQTRFFLCRNFFRYRIQFDDARLFDRIGRIHTATVFVRPVQHALAYDAGRRQLSDHASHAADGRQHLRRAVIPLYRYFRLDEIRFCLDIAQNVYNGIRIAHGMYTTAVYFQPFEHITLVRFGGKSNRFALGNRRNGNRIFGRRKLFLFGTTDETRCLE